MIPVTIKGWETLLPYDPCIAQLNRMRHRPSWMTTKDPLVLEYLYEIGVALPPRALYTNMVMDGYEISEPTVNRSLSRLKDGGMVDNPEMNDSYYQITSHGIEYLEQSQDMSVSEFIEKYED